MLSERHVNEPKIWHSPNWKLRLCMYVRMYEFWRLASLAYDNLNGILTSKLGFLLFYFSIVLN